MKQYSSDLRERALRQVDAGRPVGEVAGLVGLQRTTLPRVAAARGPDELPDATKAALDAVTPADAAGCCADCGFPLPTHPT